MVASRQQEQSREGRPRRKRTFSDRLRQWFQKSHEQNEERKNEVVVHDENVRQPSQDQREEPQEECEENFYSENGEGSYDLARIHMLLELMSYPASSLQARQEELRRAEAAGERSILNFMRTMNSAPPSDSR